MDVCKLFQLWHDHSVSNDELKELLGLTKHQFYSLKAKHSLPTRPIECQKPNPSRGSNEWEPTPAEIEERAAQVRSWWTPEEEERRRVGPRRQEWAAPKYHFRWNGVLAAG